MTARTLLSLSSGIPGPGCRILAMLIALAWLYGPCASALDAWAYDLRLLRTLNSIELCDYAMLQVDVMLTAYPEKKDFVLVERARTLFIAGKRQMAAEAIAQIDAKSPAFDQSRLLAGEMAFRRRDYATAEKAYADYFSKNQAPASQNPEDIREFTHNVRNYSRALDEQGKGKEAHRVLELLAKIEGGESGISDRQMTFMKVQRLLDVEEEKHSNRDPVDTKAIEEALKALEQLPWGEQDGVAAAACAEIARAYILLGQEDKAIQILKAAEPLMTQIEYAMIREGGAKARAGSPVAPALYYYGRASEAKAFKLFEAGKKDEAWAQMLEAAKRFYLCVDQYDESPYKTKAATEYRKCQSMLKDHYHIQIKSLCDSDEDPHEPVTGSHVSGNQTGAEEEPGGD